MRKQLETALDALDGIDPLEPPEAPRSRAPADALWPREDDAVDGAWLVVAYEPVWAIGTGLAARGSDAAAMADQIRQVLSEHGPTRSAEDVAVLYGGSVTSATLGEFLAEPSLDGALVGGASLRLEEMAAIVARAAMTARARAAAGSRS